MHSSLEFLLRTLTERWVLMLLSLLLALATVNLVRRATSSTREAKVAIVLECTEPDQSLYEQDPETVSVTFRGALDDLQKLDRVPQLTHVIQASAYDKTATVTRLEIRNLPAGIQPLPVPPFQVVFGFDSNVETNLPVAVRTVGIAAGGRGGIEYAPTNVLVRIPKRRVAGLPDKLETEPLDIDGRISDITRRLAIRLPHPWITLVSNDSVTATARIRDADTNVVFKALPVYTLSLPNRTAPLVVTPPEVDVVLRGPPDQVLAIVRERVRVYVEDDGLVGGHRRRIEPSVHVAGATLLSGQLHADTIPENVELSLPAPVLPGTDLPSERIAP